MRFHAQRRPLGGTGGPLHGCRRSRGPRSWSQETRRARWRGFVRGVDMGGPGPTGRPYPTALECRAVDAPTGEGHGHGIAIGTGRIQRPRAERRRQGQVRARAGRAWATGHGQGRGLVRLSTHVHVANTGAHAHYTRAWDEPDRRRFITPTPRRDTSRPQRLVMCPRASPRGCELALAATSTSQRDLRATRTVWLECAPRG